jgi:hypothetical protein
VNPRASVDDVEKRKFLTLPELELRPLGRGQSLYRLRYPDSYIRGGQILTDRDFRLRPNIKPVCKNKE